MKNFIYIICSLFLFTSITFAGKRFSDQGTISSFDYNPEAYNLRHSVNYYIPNNLVPGMKAKVIVLLHGGGASTNTYASSKSIAQMYLKDFKRYAEENNTIMIAPGSSVGWSFITRVLVREVLDMAKMELDMDSNKTILFGHSMGGMGITREGHWLADMFSGMMPTAAGMDDKYRAKEFYLNTYFNVPFVHINGELDHFAVFKTRSLAVQKDIKTILEPLYNLKSQYQLIFHPGGHNYNLAQVYEELDNLFAKKRNLYQKNIFPLFQNLHVRNSQYGPDVDYLLDRYFWLKVDFKENTKAALVHGVAKIKNNIIEIDIDTSKLSKMDIYLSSKNIDFTKNIEVIINGQSKFSQKLSPDSSVTESLKNQYNDENFIFENMITIKL